MKKVLIAVMALAAVACNKAEVVEVTSDNAITFDNVFVDNATKSVSDPSYSMDPNGNLFEDFAVYGFVKGSPGSDAATLFNDKRVYKENTEWKYVGTQYWIDGALYYFAAVAPSTGRKWALQQNGLTMEGTKLSFTNDGTQDVVYAQIGAIEGEASGNETVAFTFRHILSKVKFSFVNKYDAENTKLRVENIKITNPYEKADVLLKEGSTEWGNRSTTTQNFSLDFGNAIADNDNAITADPFNHDEEVESYKQLLLIPADYTSTKLAISFTYTIIVDDVDIKTFKETPTVSINLEPGHAYDFKATIEPGEEIQFSVEKITDWTNGNTHDGNADDVKDYVPIQ